MDELTYGRIKLISGWKIGWVYSCIGWSTINQWMYGWM